MKVGTDSVLLGAWAPTQGVTAVLDVGTGTGLLALMLAQRVPHAAIDAIDIDDDACQQAAMNFSASAWSDRLSIFRTTIQAFRSARLYDLIICNPPYFQSGPRSGNSARRTARHDDSLTLPELVAAVQRHLTADGRFCLILPADQKEAFEASARTVGLTCIRFRRVRPGPQLPPKRVLLEFAAESHRSVVEEPSMMVELSRHEYAPDYVILAKEFLLKM